jgi:hypothetical protein
MTLDNLRNLKNGKYNYNKFICYKDDDSIEIYFPESIKTSSRNEDIIINLPNNFKTCFFSNKRLKKLAASCEGKDTNSKMQSSIKNAINATGSIPDIVAIKQIYSYLTGKQPNKMTFRYSQWGGHGYTLDTGRINSRVNNFFPIGVSIDSYLGSIRPENNDWGTSTEKRLEEFHKDVEDDRSKYNLSWSERIRQKNLKRLQDILTERKMRELATKNNEPRRIREMDRLNENIVGYVPADERLDKKRNIPNAEHIVGRIEESVPDWYANLPTRRLFASKIEKVAEAGRGAPNPFEYTPGRRNERRRERKEHEQYGALGTGNNPGSSSLHKNEAGFPPLVTGTSVSSKTDSVNKNKYNPFATNTPVFNPEYTKERQTFVPPISDVDIAELLADMFSNNNANNANNANNDVSLERRLNQKRRPSMRVNPVNIWPGGGQAEQREHPQVTTQQPPGKR